MRVPWLAVVCEAAVNFPLFRSVRPAFFGAFSRGGCKVDSEQGSVKRPELANVQGRLVKGDLTTGEKLAVSD